jgi:hypothetical protein
VDFRPFLPALRYDEEDADISLQIGVDGSIEAERAKQQQAEMKRKLQMGETAVVLGRVYMSSLQGSCKQEDTVLPDFNCNKDKEKYCKLVEGSELKVACSVYFSAPSFQRMNTCMW